MRVTALLACSVASVLLLQDSGNAAPITHNVLNAGFDSASGNLATNWNSLGGSIRGGSQGGFGWTTGYFVGNVYPTNSTFGTTVNGPVRQDLTGLNSTFVAGRAYTLSVDLFSAGNYTSANGAIAWTIGLAANGTTVAADSWYSDEVAGAPADHVIPITAATNGPTTAMLTYIATAADHGKTIGIQIGGTDTLGLGGDDYYGMVDSVSLTSVETPEPSSMAIMAVVATVAFASFVVRRRQKRAD